MDRMRLTVLSPDGPVFERDVSYVNLPMDFGSIGVLPRHETMLVRLAPGILLCRFEGGSLRLRISAGVCQVENDQITALVDRGDILEN